MRQLFIVTIDVASPRCLRSCPDVDFPRFAIFSQNALLRLLDALADPLRRERTALFMLAGYAAVWTLYGPWLPRAARDIHFDMGRDDRLGRGR